MKPRSCYLDHLLLGELYEFLFGSAKDVQSDRQESFDGGHHETGEAFCNASSRRIAYVTLLKYVPIVK